jgi:uncharacterized membrane protein YhaH (DUF805 family)
MDWRELYFSSRGRLDRRRFWLASLPLIGAQIMAEMLVSSDGGAVLGWLLYLALATPCLVLTIKRLHDRGRSGWFTAVTAIPLVGAIWLLVETACLPGTPGPNRFGPDPLDADGAASATALI